MKKPKRLSSECWIVQGECDIQGGEAPGTWIVRVFWGRNAERAAHEHADNAKTHDRGLVIEWHRDLGEWAELEEQARNLRGYRPSPSPVKGVNKFDPDRRPDADNGAPVFYTVKRAVFTRLF